MKIVLTSVRALTEDEVIRLNGLLQVIEIGRWTVMYHDGALVHLGIEESNAAVLEDMAILLKKSLEKGALNLNGFGTLLVPAPECD
jgi:hypothetical protein